MRLTSTLLGLVSLAAALVPYGVNAQSTAKGAEQKGEYFLVHDEDPACTPFLRNLNRFRHLDFDACHPRLSPSSEFKRPEWKEVPLDLAVAEKTFKGVTLLQFSDRRDAVEDAERRWQVWLRMTEASRSSGGVKMWVTEIDADNDGVVDQISRVQYAKPASDRPVHERGCVYTHSGLWMLKGADETKEKLFNRRVGRFADVLMSSKTGKTYAVGWGEAKIGDARSLMLARAGQNHGPVPVCRINWLPGDQYRLLQGSKTK